MAQDYWWVTRPKRKLNSIPEELAAFCAVALGKKWTGNRELHLALEDELENSGTKRIGERRDARGSGGRTHAAMLYSLGLWFEKNDIVHLTLAGDAILSGKSAVEVLKRQVLNFQYPSAYSDSVHMTSRFKIRPFLFLLKLLMDNRLENYLSQDEIAFIISINAENESVRCYEAVVKNIRDYRDAPDDYFDEAYFEAHDASKRNLMDLANTIMNWIDYTRLVYREKSIIGLSFDKEREVSELLDTAGGLIQYPIEPDIFQRKYGLDPWHQKDTRNLLMSKSISSIDIDRNRILRAFFIYASLHPVRRIDHSIVMEISNASGTIERFTEDVLQSAYPNGALGGYLTSYREMAFQGRDEAINFEKATANLFSEVFGFEAKHVGQRGAKSVPDVLLVSDEDGYQAIIDNKAYSQYSISNDHHNRMVHNYLRNIDAYSASNYPIGFFTYISGGFSPNFDAQLRREHVESRVNGSGITVSTLIHLIELHEDNPFSHTELRRIFGLNRVVLPEDIYH